MEEQDKNEVSLIDFLRAITNKHGVRINFTFVNNANATIVASMLKEDLIDNWRTESCLVPDNDKHLQYMGTTIDNQKYAVKQDELELFNFDCIMHELAESDN